MHLQIYTKMACFLACVISLFTSKPRNICTPKRWKKSTPPQPGHWFAWILWANARLEPLLCVSWQPGSRQCRCVDVSLTNVGESQMVAGGSCCLGIFFVSFTRTKEMLSLLFSVYHLYFHVCPCHHSPSHPQKPKLSDAKQQTQEVHTATFNWGFSSYRWCPLVVIQVAIQETVTSTLQCLLALVFFFSGNFGWFWKVVMVFERTCPKGCICIYIYILFT